MRLRCFLLFALPAVGSARAAPAQAVSRVVDSVATLVEAYYVAPDTARLIAEHLRARLRLGAYPERLTPGQLADALTIDLKVVNGDLHLYAVLSAANPGAGAGSGPVMRRMVPGGGGGAVPDPARRANFDFQKLSHLEGNVGYLEVSGVVSRGGDAAFRVADAAMTFLEHSDAVIVDLRRTRGGDPIMSDYLASYFFGPDSVRTLNTYDRLSGQTFERWTRSVAGRRRPDIDVFILTGPGTFSGTEDFAFIFKQSGRGTLVGERTAGAGRTNRLYPAGGGIEVSISGGRTFDPRTGAEWERVGIQPDIAVPADRALLVAHSEALRRLASRATEPPRREGFEWARELIEARLHPVAVPAGDLRGLAGTYSARIVTEDGGVLYYQRQAGRPREALVPLGADRFALGESARLTFLAGAAGAMTLRVSALGQPDAVLARQ